MAQQAEQVQQKRITEILTPTQEAAVLRCLVLASRHYHAQFTGTCRSPFECERCYMPADMANKPCEVCGWEKIVPLQDHGDDPLWNRREQRYEVRT